MALVSNLSGYIIRYYESTVVRRVPVFVVFVGLVNQGNWNKSNFTVYIHVRFKKNGALLFLCFNVVLVT